MARTKQKARTKPYIRTGRPLAHMSARSPPNRYPKS